MSADPALRPERGLIANAWLVAKREFRERVRSRLFFVSTLLLASLAVGVSLTPVLIQAADRGTTTRIAVASDDAKLTDESISILSGYLNPPSSGGQPDPYRFVPTTVADATPDAIASGSYAGALIVSRRSDGQIAVQFLAGDQIGTDRVQQLQVGSFAIGIFDWIKSSGAVGAGTFHTTEFVSAQIAAGANGGGAKPIDAAEYAGRRIVGVVFVVLIFITLVIYGMWVAAGVVAEKSTRVMELLISAATPGQLVLGKVIGIGLAGLVQYLAILLPALMTLLFQDRIATVVLGTSSGVNLTLTALTPGLLAAYGAFWILGFILYALIYAAAGSLVSRAEDLQVLALPLSLIAIGGYLQAVMALSGGIGPLVRISSYIPFWSPFVMLTRLTVGHVEPWELVLSFGLLAASIPIVAVIAVRVYSAGVLLYGQRPGARAIVGAIVRPPV
ncbi:MAG TPA: ABC transporter permease [Candidatus Dormibacteraeota bacterium]|nr:ABC transporter permease [Candidatus Dormibacteraeota bacterium]